MRCPSGDRPVATLLVQPEAVGHRRNIRPLCRRTIQTRCPSGDIPTATSFSEPEAVGHLRNIRPLRRRTNQRVAFTAIVGEESRRCERLCDIVVSHGVSNRSTDLARPIIHAVRPPFERQVPPAPGGDKNSGTRSSGRTGSYSEHPPDNQRSHQIHYVWHGKWQHLAASAAVWVQTGSRRHLV
jgi:hypothetical protein